MISCLHPNIYYPLNKKSNEIDSFLQQTTNIVNHNEFEKLFSMIETSFPNFLQKNPKLVFYLHKCWYLVSKKLNQEELSNIIFDRFILPIYEKYLQKRNNERRDNFSTIEEKIEKCLDKIKRLLAENLEFNEEEVRNAMDIDIDEPKEEKNIIDEISPSENESGMSDLEYEIQLYKEKKKLIFEISKNRPVINKKIKKEIEESQQNNIFNPFSVIDNSSQNKNDDITENTNEKVETTIQDDYYTNKKVKENYINDPYSNYNKYNRQPVPKVVIKQKERFKSSIPFLRTFNPKFLKKENIDKKIFRKFRNFIKNQYNSIITIKTEELILYKDQFWKDFCTKNLLPPMSYQTHNNRILQFKSFNTKYFIWLFSQNGTAQLFQMFTRECGQSIISSFVSKYDLNTKEKEIIPKLEKYLNAIPSIYSKRKEILQMTSKQFEQNDDNNNTYIGTQELSNDEESSQSSNNIFNLNFGKIYNEDNKKGDNNSIYSYDKDDLLYSYRNELFDGIK